MKLKVSTFEQEISSASLGNNVIQITNENIKNAFNNSPAGTIFNPSISVTYNDPAFPSGTGTGNVEVSGTPYVPPPPPPPPSFTLANLLARYDASVASGYTLSGSNVTQWNDLTGNGYHLTPNGTGPTLTTIKSVPAFNFNSGYGLIRASVPLSTSITVFMVAKYSTAIATWGSFMHHGHRDMDWAIERDSWNSNVHFQSGNSGNAILSAANNTNYIWIGRIVGNTREFWRYSDTVSTGFVSGTPVSITPGNKTLYVGKSDGNEACNSTIGEILYYNESLSDADVSANLLYLRNKWFS